jgi:hypothetical protein
MTAYLVISRISRAETMKVLKIIEVDDEEQYLDCFVSTLSTSAIFSAFIIVFTENLRT